jgi:hypothetical protein
LRGNFSRNFLLLAPAHLIVVVLGGVVPTDLELGLSGRCIGRAKPWIPAIFLPVKIGMSWLNPENILETNSVIMSSISVGFKTD